MCSWRQLLFRGSWPLSARLAPISYLGSKKFPRAVTKGDMPRPALHAIPSGVDPTAAERGAADLLAALGADLGDESLRETPRRMAAAYAEMLTPEPFNATTFPND